MKVDTTLYRYEMGVPQGRQPAAWSFLARRGEAWTTIAIPYPMKLAEAKRWALAEARSFNADFIQLET